MLDYDKYIIVNKKQTVELKNEGSHDETTIFDKIEEKLKQNKSQIQQLINNYDNTQTQIIQEEEIGIPTDCCNLGKKGRFCICNKSLYQIRPYTFEILRAIQPFFEVVGMSHIPFIELE